jgi:Na+/melibiose symporter-like transporter
MMGAMFFLPQFLQLVQGMNPLQSGLAILPGALGLLIASVFSPRLAERWGARRTIVTGLIVVTGALIGMSTVSPHTGYAFTGITLGCVGLGLGLALPQATNGVLASVPRERAGMGSAVNDMMSELGGSFGVAILGAVLSIFYRQHIEEAITAAGDAITAVPPAAVEAARESLAAASIAAGRFDPGSADVAEVYRSVVGQAFVSGMTWALLIGAVFSAIGVVIAWRRFPAHVERVEE